MVSTRHILKSGTLTPDEIKTDIEADITSARTAQTECVANGQNRLADTMGKAVDGYLDGTWTSRNA